jgi:hypothetical protein
MFEVWSINYFEDLEEAPQNVADHLISVIIISTTSLIILTNEILR